MCKASYATQSIRKRSDEVPWRGSLIECQVISILNNGRFSDLNMKIKTEHINSKICINK